MAASREPPTASMASRHLSLGKPMSIKVCRCSAFTSASAGVLEAQAVSLPAMGCRPAGPAGSGSGLVVEPELPGPSVGFSFSSFSAMVFSPRRMWQRMERTLSAIRLPYTGSGFLPQIFITASNAIL